MVYYVGIDLGQKFSYVTTMDEHGCICCEGKVANTSDAYSKYLKRLKGSVKIVIEATRNWEYLYDILEGQADEIFLAHPLKVKAIASARIKTDRIDSKILAHLLRTNLLPTAYIPIQDIRDLRQILRHRIFLVRLLTRIKNRVHILLSKQGIKYNFSDLFGSSGIQWLKTLLLRETYQSFLNHYLRIILQLKSEISVITKKIEQTVKMTPEIKRLTTIPGIGYQLAFIIWAEIGDISRFPSPKNLCSYAGLVPSVYSSGRTLRYGKITKQGSKWLRWAMVEAAIQAVNKPGRYQKLYYRLLRRKGNKIARIAVARELLCTVFYILSKNEDYKEQY